MSATYVRTTANSNASKSFTCVRRAPASVVADVLQRWRRTIGSTRNCLQKFYVRSVAARAPRRLLLLMFSNVGGAQLVPLELFANVSATIVNIMEIINGLQGQSPD